MAESERNYLPDREAYLEVMGLMTFWRDRSMRAELGNPKWDIDVSRLPVLFATSVHMLNGFSDIISQYLGIDRDQFLQDTALSLAAWDDDTSRG